MKMWSGYAAAFWALVFAALHIVWAAGWYIGLEDEAARKAFQNPWFLLYDVVVAAICLIGAGVALAIARGRRHRAMTALAWCGAIVLLLRGLAGLAQVGSVARTARQLLSLSVFWEYWFVLGGVLFLLTARSGSRS